MMITNQEPSLIRLLMLTSVVFGLLLFGCAPQPEPAEEAVTEPEAAPAEEAPAEEAVPEAKAVPGKSLMNPSALKEQAPDTFMVKFATTKGDFVVEATRASAPRGADRFYNLVKNGFYDECRFFRVVPNFVVQFGMNGDPAVSRLWTDARFPDDPVIRTNRKGSIVFAATSDPNSRTTQLFINMRDNRALNDRGFAPFGRVVEGMDVVESLYSGYGELPDQGMITNQGNSYLKSKFPNLDYIKTATIQP